VLESMENKVVVITGGSSGYGKATAKRFTEEGARVITTGRDEEALQLARAEVPGLETYRADATRWEDWQQLHAGVMQRHGRIDVLVNNAGSGVAIVDTVDQTREAVDEVIAVNLTSAVYGSMLFGKPMQAQRSGTIVNISSACATEAWPKFSVYAAAKAGVVSLSKGLYTELRPFNVRVAVVIPGAGATNWSKNAGLAEPASPYLLTGEDVAEVILHICRMPAHVQIEEYRVWGMDQEVIPL
jgi:NAD(P)-dependent dehydrogenase (short-subunit alcohol dehydrogenase family)